MWKRELNNVTLGTQLIECFHQKIHKNNSLWFCEEPAEGTNKLSQHIYNNDLSASLFLWVYHIYCNLCTKKVYWQLLSMSGTSLMCCLRSTHAYRCHNLPTTFLYLTLPYLSSDPQELSALVWDVSAPMRWAWMAIKIRHNNNNHLWWCVCECWILRW